MWTRRQLLQTGLAPFGAPLKKLAAKRGVLFGSAVSAKLLRTDAAYAALVARECAVIVPAVEAKWAATEPGDGSFDFADLDWLARYAGAHGMRLRLHNLAWGVYNPPWAVLAARSGRGEAILRRHIAVVAGHMRGQAMAWDVINEPSDPRWNEADGLAAILWKKAMGPGYFDAAFGWAQAADPDATLFVNDDLLEYDDAASAAKRATYLRLIEAALARGVPVQGFGLESHLRPERRFSQPVYRAFLRDLAGMGLVIHVSELDVCDHTLSADPARRDSEIGALTKAFLDTVLDEPAVQAVLTWGLTTRDSWLNKDPAMRRPDGLPTRGLPFDDAFAATGMGQALTRAFSG